MLILSFALFSETFIHEYLYLYDQTYALPLQDPSAARRQLTRLIPYTTAVVRALDSLIKTVENEDFEKWMKHLDDV